MLRACLSHSGRDLSSFSPIRDCQGLAACSRPGIVGNTQPWADHAPAGPSSIIVNMGSIKKILLLPEVAVAVAVAGSSGRRKEGKLQCMHALLSCSAAVALESARWPTDGRLPSLHHDACMYC